MKVDMITSLEEFRFLIEKGMLHSYPEDVSLDRIETVIQQILKEWQKDDFSISVKLDKIIVEINRVLSKIELDYLLNTFYLAGRYYSKIIVTNDRDMPNTITIDKLYKILIILNRTILN